MKIRCDKCSREFEHKAKRIKTENIENGFKRTFIQCPNNKCKATFTVGYLNEEAEKLRNQWQREGAVHGTPTHKKLVKELRKVNEYMQQKNG